MILAITFHQEGRCGDAETRAGAPANSGEIAHRLRIQDHRRLLHRAHRQVPVLARFGAQPEIVEDARELYLEAAARVFKEFNPASEKLLAHLDNDISQGDPAPRRPG